MRASPTLLLRHCSVHWCRWKAIKRIINHPHIHRDRRRLESRANEIGWNSLFHSLVVVVVGVILQTKFPNNSSSVLSTWIGNVHVSTFTVSESTWNIAISSVDEESEKMNILHFGSCRQRWNPLKNNPLTCWHLNNLVKVSQHIATNSCSLSMHFLSAKIHSVWAIAATQTCERVQEEVEWKWNI